MHNRSLRYADYARYAMKMLQLGRSLLVQYAPHLGTADHYRWIHPSR
jgi:hypothetical protein